MKDTLKTYLLNTNCFENNEFLELYCKLIITNLNTQQIKSVTQSHHIIPKSLYKVLKLKPNNTKKNKVNLLFKDHILAHYYLSLCSINTELKFYMENALMLLCNTQKFDVKALEFYHNCYLDWRKQSSERMMGENNPFFGKHLSEESRAKLSAAHRGKKLSEETKAKLRKPCTEERRQKLIEYYKNNTHPSTGVKWSESDKQKISELTKAGMQHWRENCPEAYEEFCKKVSISSTGRRHSDETKQKMSRDKLGEKNPMFGKPSPSRRAVYCVELNLSFDCIREAANYTKCHANHISKCCRGKIKITGGYHWKYLEEIEKNETFESR